MRTGCLLHKHTSNNTDTSIASEEKGEYKSQETNRDIVSFTIPRWKGLCKETKNQTFTFCKFKIKNPEVDLRDQ